MLPIYTGWHGARRQFCDEFLRQVYEENISAGINGEQALWLHHRLSKLSISVGNQDIIVDIFNCLAVGDIEVMRDALRLAEVDDGSQAYHWFTDERRDLWVQRITDFLGRP